MSADVSINDVIGSGVGVLRALKETMIRSNVNKKEESQSESESED